MASFKKLIYGLKKKTVQKLTTKYMSPFYPRLSPLSQRNYFQFYSPKNILYSPVSRYNISKPHFNNSGITLFTLFCILMLPYVPGTVLSTDINSFNPHNVMRQTQL